MSLFNVSCKEKAIVMIAIGLYLFSAFKLVGYYHPDEHYQILEFAQSKLGKIDSGSLPWEFHYAMRSSFQPWIVIGLQKATGEINPHATAFLLRLLTAALAIISILRFIYTVRTSFKKSLVPLFTLLSFFVWFLPYLNVRFSSETWSGVFFLLAVSFVTGTQRTTRKAAICCGLLLGISFLCRYQLAIMILGLLLWLLVIRREKFSRINLIVSGCVFVTIIGLILDYFFYGYWTLSVWNYYNMNIVHDRASSFGTMDGFSFLIETIEGMTIPLGSVVALCFLFVVIYAGRSFIVWTVLPFIVVHFLIPHKEVRFLFPVANFVPYILIAGIQIVLERIASIKPQLVNSKTAKRVLNITIYIFLIFNSACLTLAVVSPPFYGRIAIAQYLNNNYPKQEIQLTGKRRNNPFNPYASLQQSFYKMENIQFNVINSYDSLSNSHALSKNSFLILQREDLENPEVFDYLSLKRAKQVKNIRPGWVTPLMDRFGMAEKDLVLFSE